ncbi:MAG TPA: hypothetical protein VG148_01165 [Pyrinomonadaceae bacterium]|nr:hypothetical protein [Pyrinomonadaceae bacterium]
MRLALLTLTFFLSLPQLAGSQSDYRPGRTGFRLHGPVRAVKEEHYNLHEDGDGIFTGNLTLRFDERGRLVESLQGNRQVEDLYGMRYSYRPDGRLAGAERFSGGSVGSRDVYVYDDARRRVEVLTYLTGGDLRMRVTKAYDERGGELRSETEFLPGDDTTAPARQVVETAHTYDERGRPLTTTVKGPDGRPMVVIGYGRDAAGLLITTTTDLRKEAQSSMAKTVRKHDAAGNETAAESYAADGTLTARISYERKFDARGNWVEEITRTWEGRAPDAPRGSAFLRRRTITYF